MPGLSDLRAANVARQAEWCPEQVPDLSFRGNELAGEVGEACNVIKKLERERQGWAGSRATLEQLSDELADVIICTDLVAMAAGVDLDAALVRKFNATSEKVGLATRLQPNRPPPAEVRATFTVGHLTMAQVFRPAGLTNLSDLQAVLDAVERALQPEAPAEQTAHRAAPAESCVRGEMGMDRKVSFLEMPPAPVPVISTTRAQAIEEAAKVATSFLVGDPANGVPLRSPTPHEIASRIRSLKEG